MLEKWLMHRKFSCTKQYKSSGRSVKVNKTKLYGIDEDKTGLNGERTEFVGVYDRIENGKIYLSDVVRAETLQGISDSLCFDYTRKFQSLGLEKCLSGLLIMFSAKIRRKEDGYHLYLPTNVRGYLAPHTKYLDDGRLKVWLNRGRWVRSGPVV